MSGPTEPTPTRRSLLSRIKNPADQRSWREFYDTYHNLIREAAVRAGLPAEEAEDTVQETLAFVSQNIGEFKATGAAGDFKLWLFEITRTRIEARKRRLAATPQPDARATAQTRTAATILAPRPPDTDSPPRTPLDRVWDEEWRRNLEERALDTLKQEVAPHEFQVFFLNVIKGNSVLQVARALDTNALKVYLLKRRLQPRYQRALREAEDHAGAPRIPPPPAS